MTEHEYSYEYKFTWICERSPPAIPPLRPPNPEEDEFDAGDSSWFGFGWVPFFVATEVGAEAGRSQVVLLVPGW